MSPSAAEDAENRRVVPGWETSYSRRRQHVYPGSSYSLNIDLDLSPHPEKVRTSVRMMILNACLQIALAQ